MNKRGILKFVLLLFSSFATFKFLTNADETGFITVNGHLLFIGFVVAGTIFMYCKKNKIKKFKFVYDVVLMLMMLFVGLFIAYFIYANMITFFNPSYEMEFNIFLIEIYPVILWLIILFSIEDIFKKTNKTNDYLTIAISITIIILILRYYIDPTMPHNVESTSLFSSCAYEYMIQNLPSFIIMYILLLIHHAINKEK